MIRQIQYSVIISFKIKPLPEALIWLKEMAMITILLFLMSNSNK